MLPRQNKQNSVINEPNKKIANVVLTRGAPDAKKKETSLLSSERFSNKVRGNGEFPRNQPIKICSWNVNGFRNHVEGIKGYIEKSFPDILCIQELRFHFNTANIVELFDDEAFRSYHIYINCSSKKNGQHGTLVLTKIPPINVKLGMDVPKHDGEGRIIVLEFEKFFLVGVYAPNPITSDQSYNYRTGEWDIDFIKFISKIKELTPSKELIIIGRLECDTLCFRCNHRKGGEID